MLRSRAVNDARRLSCRHRLRGLALVLAALLGCSPKKEERVAQVPGGPLLAATPPAVAPAPAPAPPVLGSAPAAAPLPDPPWRTPRHPEQEAALARDSAKLEALRSAPLGTRLGCAQFRSLSLAEGLARRQAEGQDDVNECSREATEIVRCFETEAGLFVPVEQPDIGCDYRLWFVPRAREKPVVPLTAELAEFDIEFTLALGPDDTNGDGVTEALLVRGWAHPEGVGADEEAFAVEADGSQRRLPFNRFKDVDSDGRYDVIIDWSELTNDGSCTPPDEIEPWVAQSLASPPLVLHRLQGFTFSLRDEVARKARAKQCENLGNDVVARRQGVVDEDETMRRTVCRLADGADPAAVKKALAAACTRDYQAPADCKQKRPGVCYWRKALLGTPAAFEALAPWLSEDR
jgi:hypothetical protein